MEGGTQYAENVPCDRPQIILRFRRVRCPASQPADHQSGCGRCQPHGENHLLGCVPLSEGIRHPWPCSACSRSYSVSKRSTTVVCEMPFGTKLLCTKMVFPLFRQRPTMPPPLLRIPLFKYPIWWHRPGWRTMRRSHGRFTVSISSTLPRRTSWSTPSTRCSWT